MILKILKDGTGVDEAEERMRELENQAVDNFLDDSCFDAIEWLPEEDKSKYCELRYFVGATVSCICGDHEDETE